MKNNYNFTEFVLSNLNQDPNSLRLSLKQENFDFDLEDAINQIECRKKNLNKLKKFLEFPEFIFPDSISAEQASHQAVALFHSSLIQEESKLLDMTSGLGIDSFTFASKGIYVTSLEINTDKAKALSKNSKTLNLTNIQIINLDSLEFLKNTRECFDVIYVDPSRRDSEKKRVYNLKDCQPDIFLNQNLLLSKATRILIKASPLLDIRQTIKDFSNIKSIRAVGVKGECKEILIELQKDYCGSEIMIEAIDLDNEGKIINHFTTGSSATKKNSSKINYAIKEDLKSGYYILEPSSMIMKISPWEKLCEKYNAKKFDNSSDIFISPYMPKDFPGRVTIIDNLIKKQDRKSLSGFPASVISRNYPVSSEELRKNLKLKEGDKNFIYATRLDKNPVMILSHSF